MSPIIHTIEILRNKQLIGPACLPLLTVVVMLLTAIRLTLVLYAGPVYWFAHRFSPIAVCSGRLIFFNTFFFLSAPGIFHIHQHYFSIEDQLLKTPRYCYPNGFSWGHQCSRTLTSVISMEVSNMEFYDRNLKLPGLRQGFNLLSREVWGGWGEEKCPNKPT